MRLKYHDCILERLARDLALSMTLSCQESLVILTTFLETIMIVDLMVEVSSVE